MRVGARALRPPRVPAAAVRRTASPLAPAPGCNKTLLALLILLDPYMKSHIIVATLRVAPAARGPFYSTNCFSIALARATRSGRRAIDDLAADPGRAPGRPG